MQCHCVIVAIGASEFLDHDAQGVIGHCCLLAVPLLAALLQRARQLSRLKSRSAASNSLARAP
jgi:hypothetical protein